MKRALKRFNLLINFAKNTISKCIFSKKHPLVLEKYISCVNKIMTKRFFVLQNKNKQMHAYTILLLKFKNGITNDISDKICQNITLSN